MAKTGEISYPKTSIDGRMAESVGQCELQSSSCGSTILVHPAEPLVPPRNRVSGAVTGPHFNIYTYIFANRFAII